VAEYLLASFVLAFCPLCFVLSPTNFVASSSFHATVVGNSSRPSSTRHLLPALASALAPSSDPAAELAGRRLRQAGTPSESTQFRLRFHQSDGCRSGSTRRHSPVQHVADERELGGRVLKPLLRPPHGDLGTRERSAPAGLFSTLAAAGDD